MFVPKPHTHTHTHGLLTPFSLNMLFVNGGDCLSGILLWGSPVHMTGQADPLLVRVAGRGKLLPAFRSHFMAF